MELSNVPTVKEYGKWTNERLIARVTSLEQELRESNAKYSIHQPFSVYSGA